MSISNPGLALIQLHNVDHLAFLRANHLLRSYDLTIQQSLILHYLENHKENNINQKNIESYLGISNPSVTSLMKTMVNKHLIRRFPDRNDARSYLLALTARGQQLQQHAAEIFVQLSHDICCGVTEEELAQFSHILDKLTSNLNAMLDEETQA